MIKFIHFSDTHLGFSDLDIQDKEGNNIKEEDVFKSFRNVIDIIIERKPDFVIHAGDIFHRSSPTNKALIVAVQELSRLTQNRIPIYIAAGNHDFPKSSFTKPIHYLFETISLGKIFFNEKYETLEEDKYIIHTLPHINNEAVFNEEALKISVKDRSKKNIFITHLSLPYFTMEEFGERVLPAEALNVLKDFDYVALGHWHKFAHINKYGAVYYSGSTERFSLSEYGYDKGIAEVRIGDKTEVEFISIPTRNCFTITVDNCSERNKNDIIRAIEESAKRLCLPQSIIHISLNDLNTAQYYEITKEDLNEIFKDVLYFSYSKTIKSSSEQVIYDSESFDLREHLNSELQKKFNDPAELAEASKLTSEILDEIEEEEANEDK